MKLAAAAFWILLFTLRASGTEIGFQQIEVPAPSGKPLMTGIWYPNSSKVSAQPLGLFRQEVALDGEIAGAALTWRPVGFDFRGPYLGTRLAYKSRSDCGACCSYLFGTGGLDRVTVPVQLWRADSTSLAWFSWIAFTTVCRETNCLTKQKKP